MGFNMERWHMAATRRFAVRRYAGAPTDEELDSLDETADMLSTLGLSIRIGFGDGVFAPIFFGMGKVTGTDCFAAFIADDSDITMAGYLGEAFVLECTALGLGTCWLGASYKKNEVRRILGLKKNDNIMCITPIGAPDEAYSSRPRKALSKLTGLTQEQLVNLPDWQRYALECGRIAPSAMNGQPWEFEVIEKAMAIHNIGTNFGYGRLDCGIAMLHMEIGAAHGGVIGKWELTGKDAEFTATDFNK